jgi:LmbE family N-acetylglucosaminyl deacetylase
MSKVVCVIAAHPDDEVLGCGGAMARYVSAGYVVHVLILAEGIVGRFVAQERQILTREIELLSLQAKKAHEVLGSHSLEMLSFPDNRLDSVDLLDIVKVIENFLERHQPAFVFTHHAGDVNIDHRIVSQAVTAACRPLKHLRNLEGVFLFEVPSSTEWQLPGMYPTFAPNFFINIEGHLQQKLDSLACYASEMRPFPHSRSYEAIEALAKWRGACAGFAAAEAFMIGRLRY